MNEQEIIKQYQQTKSISEVCKALNVSSKRINEVLTKYGIKHK